MSNENVIKLHPKPLDILCEAYPGVTATLTSTVAQPATTLSSTMAFTGRTNLTVPADDWRKPQRRKCYAALDGEIPHGLPIEFQMKKVVEEVIDYCLENGWPEPKPKTVRRAIRDRYFPLTFGST